MLPSVNCGSGYGGLWFVIHPSLLTTPRRRPAFASHRNLCQAPKTPAVIGITVANEPVARNEVGRLKETIPRVPVAAANLPAKPGLARV